MLVSELPYYIKSAAWVELGAGNAILPCGAGSVEASQRQDKYVDLRLQRTVSDALSSSMLQYSWAMEANVISLCSAFDAAALAEELSRSTPSPIPYRAPPNYALLFSALGTGGAIVIGALFFWTYFSAFFLSRWLWALGSILSSLIFTSGYMFVRIRGMPFAHMTREGAQWIAGGYQNQYGAETYVISTLCESSRYPPRRFCLYNCGIDEIIADGTLGLAQIALVLLVPRIPKPNQQRAAIYIWTGVTILLYSVLISLFRLKNSGE